MFVLTSSLRLAFTDGDIEFDFVLMTTAYNQYLKVSCKHYLLFIIKQNIIQYQWSVSSMCTPIWKYGLPLAPYSTRSSATAEKQRVSCPRQGEGD